MAKLSERMKNAHYIADAARADLDKMRLWMRGVPAHPDADRVARMIDEALRKMDRVVAAFEA